MTLAEFPYFENVAIDRKLNREGILSVINHLIASGMPRGALDDFIDQSK
jgi:hypothetical protein